MDQDGQWNPNEAEDTSASLIFFEDEVAVNEAVQGVDGQEKGPPSNRRGKMEINEQVPSPKGFSNMQKEKGWGGNEQQGRDHNSDFPQRLIFFHAKPIREGGEDKGSRTETR